MFDSVLESYGGVEVEAMDVYANIFGLGDGLVQVRGEENETRDMVANPIIYYRYNDRKSGVFRIMFEDDFEANLLAAQAADFAIINGISYFGRRNKLEHASKMHALIFDLDGCTDETVAALCHQCSNPAMNPVTKEMGTVNPMPNYIVLSGANLHLYYLFEEPIPLYPDVKIQLKEFKFAMTKRLWNAYTSTIEVPQFQGINQGFRPVGGKTKDGDGVVRAFEMYSHPYTIEQLNEFVPEGSRVNVLQRYAPSKFTLQEAKKKWPEWYQKVVVGNDRQRVEWAIEEKVHGDNPHALYDWWLRQIMSGITFGHRYFGIMALAIYAAKCHLSEERLEKDAYELIPFMNSINPQEVFTEADVRSALECYDSRYCTFPRSDIEKLTAIPIPPNKRNGRSRAIHLAGARAIQEINDKFNGTSWRSGNGRKSKEAIVLDWLDQHPNGSKADCIRDTGLSKPTVYKYWRTKQSNHLPLVLGVGSVAGNGAGDDGNGQQGRRLLSYAERMRLKENKK